MPRTVSAAAFTALRTASLKEFGELPTTSVIRTTAFETWSCCSDIQRLKGGGLRLTDHRWREGTRLAASTGAWIVFEDEAGATLRPPKARAWAVRGHTPQVAVSGRGGRVSMAALVCYRPGCRGRLFYRIGVHRRRRGERRSFLRR